MENASNTVLVQDNQEELLRFEQVFRITTEPSFFYFQYDTDLVRMDCQVVINEIISPKKACVLDCSSTQSDNLLIEIHKIIKEKPCDLIHIINIEQAVNQYPAILLKLNTERETIFRDLSVHIVFWTNQFTTNTLQKEAFDFWSWIVFIFILKTPESFLTERQKGFKNKLDLQDNYSFELTAKDPTDRLNELERQLKIANDNIATTKGLKDYHSITILYADELRENGEYVKAKIVLEEAIKILENNNLDEELNILANNLATVYQDLGDLQKAKELLEKALENGIINFGDKHPTVAIRQSNLATVYQDLGNLQKAKELLEKALENDIINFGDKHPTVAICQSNLAIVYKDLGNLQKAKELLEKALSTSQIKLGVDHRQTKAIKRNLDAVLSEIKNKPQ